MLDLLQYDYKRDCFILKDTTTKPANAFDWKRFTDEERERRGETRNENNTSRKRSIASTKAIERIRVGEPSYGTVGINTKTALMISLKPKTFNVYSGAGNKVEKAKKEKK
jgi:hypothetical protein